MKVPFSKELDETFRSDRSLWIKMAGAAFVSGFCVVAANLKYTNWDDPVKEFLNPFTAGVIAFSSVVGASLALMLSMKDVILGRMGRGEPVNPLLKLYLGMGVWSLVAWVPTIFILDILLTIVTH